MSGGRPKRPRPYVGSKSHLKTPEGKAYQELVDRLEAPTEPQNNTRRKSMKELRGE